MKTFNSCRVVLITLMLVSGCGGGGEGSSTFQTWPNEPANSTLVTDWGFNALVGGGWSNNGGSATIVSDPTAPFSRRAVAQFPYPIGFAGGEGPDNIYYDLPAATALYYGYWWKPSNPWQGHSSGYNKIQFLLGDGGDMYVAMYGSPGGPYQLRFNLQFPGVDLTYLGGSVGEVVLDGNIANTSITLGNWHRIEVLILLSTSSSSQDGTLNWWINGVLQGNYTNINYDAAYLKQFQFAPTWGGVGDTKTEADDFWFDHVHISIPNGNLVR